MLDKARTLPVDQVFMDIEDAVAPLAKPQARQNIVAALNEGGYEGKIRAVRVNDWTTQWTYSDVIEVVEGAGANLDAIMLPKSADRGPNNCSGSAPHPIGEIKWPRGGPYWYRGSN